MSLLASLLAAGACGARPEQPTAAGPLRIRLYTAPLGSDPHLESEFLTYAVLSNIFEGLTRLDPHLHVEPALAESWESPNDLTWRLHLRRGVRFHDGRRLTAADVAFSLERAHRHPRSALALYVGSVSEVRALDEATVEIVTAQPKAVLLNKLSFVSIVPAGSPDLIVEPVGTGPYRLQPARDGRALTLRAFEGYWGPRPSEPEVRLPVVPDPAEAARLLLAGELDVVPDLAPALVDRVRASRGCRVERSPGLTTDVLRMRVDRGPFADLRVRQAVHLALDRDELVRRALAGHGAPASQLVGREVLGFDGSLAPVPRDLARARRLLAEAGHRDGLEVELEFREGRQAEALRDQLAEAGIRVRLRPRPWGEMLARMRAGQVGFYFGGLVADTGDASDVLDSVVHSPTPEQGYGDGNYWGFSSPAVDAALDAARATRDAPARRDALKRAMRVVMDELPVIPVQIPDDVYGIREGVSWELRADGRVLASDVRRTR